MFWETLIWFVENIFRKCLAVFSRGRQSLEPLWCFALIHGRASNLCKVNRNKITLSPNYHLLSLQFNIFRRTHKTWQILWECQFIIQSYINVPPHCSTWNNLFMKLRYLLQNFIQGVFLHWAFPRKVKVWKTWVRWIYVDVDRPRYT